MICLARRALATASGQNGARYIFIATNQHLCGPQSNGHNSTQASRETKQTELVSQPQPGEHEDVPEQEFRLSKLVDSHLVAEEPIRGLDLVKRISKVKKTGSFSVDVFNGQYDDEFLTYPEPLRNRIENQKLKDQARIVRQVWPQVWNDQSLLEKFNFFNLYQLSATEMMTVFEAIGSASRKCYDNSLPATIDEAEKFTSQHSTATHAIISLIIRNALTYWPMHRSENEHLRALLPKHNIVLSETFNNENSSPPPISFCWTELANGFGSLPPQEWQTFGQTGGDGADFTIVAGLKHKILHNDASQHHLVYYRDKILSQTYNETEDNQPNPASDPFIGCILLHSSEMQVVNSYTDSAGFKYNDLQFNATVPNERIVFPPLRKDPKGLNIKALGQTTTCAVILGILKDAQRHAYRYLSDNRPGLLECDIIEKKLATCTAKIFAIESMVYYIAGMYDGLEEGFDAHLEAIIAKVVTNEYAYDVLRELQMICGSQDLIMSRLQDQLNIYDSFLDGNLHSRLYLSSMGVFWYARKKNIHLNKMRLSLWNSGYILKKAINVVGEQHSFTTLNADIYGSLHPALNQAATNLEFVVKRLAFATESLCAKYGTNITGAQSALHRLSQLSMDTFLLTAVCARASKSFCNGSRNSEIDIAIATHFSDEISQNVKIYMENISKLPAITLDSRSKTINELNLKMGGYYAESPLDPNA